MSAGVRPIELNLTCRGMSFVNLDSIDSDFECIFGNRVYRIHSVLAEFLSPKIAGVRRCDPLRSFYGFNDADLFDAFESLVSSLRSGTALQVDNSNFHALLRLSQELGNTDLLSSLLRMIDTKSLSLENAVLLLRLGIDLGAAFSAQFGSLRDFVASRFYRLGKEILDDLDLETARLLLSSPSLQIADEDSLYDFVRSRSDTDLSFTSLFEFIYFEYLSVDRMENFASFVHTNLLGNINSAIWMRISRRLILETNPRRKNLHKCLHWRQTEFVHDVPRFFDGIIAHLTRECGGNVHEKGIVSVTASSTPDINRQPKNVADLWTSSDFCSINAPNQWICYDFKERRVIPRSYSLKTHAFGPGGSHLKSWVIEVSNNGIENSWVEIDRRDTCELNGFLAIANFTIRNVPRERFRFFRLRQTGLTHGSNLHLVPSSMEVFGTLYERM